MIGIYCNLVIRQVVLFKLNQAGSVRPAFVRWAAVLAILGILGGCQKINHTRVKMTATVESGGTLYTGSSVQEYLCRHSTHIMNDLDNCEVKGEAVVVDIKDRGYLFLIFDMPNAQSITSMPYTILGAVSSDPMGATNSSLPKRWKLKPEQMPLMVKFRDIRVPASIEQIDPRNLEAAFGAGVKLISIELEPTSERVTFGPVKKVLPWVLDSTNHLYRDEDASPFSATLSQANFTSEYKK